MRIAPRSQPRRAIDSRAVATGARITVLATLPTTCGPTSRLIAERARAAGLTPTIRSVVVEGAFAAVASGDRPSHDLKVAAAIRIAAEDSDVVVLAQAQALGGGRQLGGRHLGVLRDEGGVAGVGQRVGQRDPSHLAGRV